MDHDQKQANKDRNKAIDRAAQTISEAILEGAEVVVEAIRETRTSTELDPEALRSMICDLFYEDIRRG